MSRAKSLLCLAMVLGEVFAAPSVWATQPHSWCMVGGALNANDGDTQEPLKGIIHDVCSDDPTCCTGRWGLSCIGKAVALARSTVLGDYCGRYAWDQGPLPGTGQYYPRDFNLVALAGEANSLRDVEGPVAARDHLGTAYFRLNYGRQQPVAAVGAATQGESVAFASGTIFGDVIYGSGQSIAPTVTFFDEGVVTQGAPIDFATTQAALVGMSQALSTNYGVPIAAWSPWQNVFMFTGNDPELNVFSLDASQLEHTYYYEFQVPIGSFVIINVIGATAVIHNAGFYGYPAPNKVLWNFPQATSLTVESVSLAGSILAPLANAALRNANIHGTVVVKSAWPASAELYMAPFQIPACTGCLCVDSQWSCSDDTSVNGDGKVLDLKPEAGFLELPRNVDYWSDDELRSSPRHRIWYSFHPAPIQPKKKPLAVFFNGGPGSATSSGLFAFGTAPKVLVDAASPRPEESPVANNPHSWTDFANVLHIDAAGTGFSYPLAEENPYDPNAPHLGIAADIDRDAGIFLSIISRFLTRHPSLLQSPVFLVGESYGGTRANAMMHHIYDYASIYPDPVTGGEYQDREVYDDLVRYFVAAFYTSQPDANQLYSKFKTLVLIQPAIGGQEQIDRGGVWLQDDDYWYRDSLRNVCLGPRCYMVQPETSETLEIDQYCDEYNCDKPLGWQGHLVDIAANRLVNLGILNAALGVDATTIEWMHARARGQAYGRGDQVQAVPDDEFRNKFVEEDGIPLNESDAFFVRHNGNVSNRMWAREDQGKLGSARFLGTIHRGVAVFLTNGYHDTIVVSRGIPTAFANLLGEVQAANTNRDYQYQDLARTGRVTVCLEQSQSIVPLSYYWPSYDAGHMVTMRAPAEMHADVTQWWELQKNGLPIEEDLAECVNIPDLSADYPPPEE